MMIGLGKKAVTLLAMFSVAILFWGLFSGSASAQD